MQTGRVKHEASLGSGLGRRERAAGAALVAGLAALVAVLALALEGRPAERSVRALAFWALSLLPLLLAHPAWLAAARRAAASAGFRWLLAGAGWAAIAVDRSVRGTPLDALGALVYVVLPLLVTVDRPRSTSPLARDVLLVLLLWIPLEVGWVRGDFVLLRLLGLDLLLLLYVLERPLFELGRILPSRRAQWSWGLGAWAVFLAVALPIAIATGFAAPGLSQRTAGGWALFVVSTLWIIALPEEALFRGTIQQLLARALGRPAVALALASVLFGLSHLNNVGRDRLADWRYVLLATLAGVAYGIAYARTGSLAAPTMTHFLVDVTWRGFFAG